MKRNGVILAVVVFGLLLASWIPSTWGQQTISLQKGVELGLVQLVSKGGHLGDKVSFQTNGTNSQDYIIEVRKGNVLLNKNLNEQNLTVSKNFDIFVPAGRSVRIEGIWTACIDAHKGSPSADGVLDLAPPLWEWSLESASQLLALLDIIDDRGVWENGAAQDAVWNITDNRSVSGEAAELLRAAGVDPNETKDFPHLSNPAASNPSTSFTIPPETPFQEGPELVFEQIDYNLDGTAVVDSSWATVGLTYRGSSSDIYFNLAVNGNWVIQNIALFSNEGVGISQTVTIAFDLGVSDGTEVAQLEYAFDITPDTLDSMPFQFDTAPVADGRFVMFSGDQGVALEAAPIVLPPRGAKIKGGARGVHKGEFPNQEAGTAECVPVAVSNSLKFLKRRHNLDIDDQDISIGRMKSATGCTDRGTPNGWWNTKDEYMRSHGYPIRTETTTDLDEVIEAIKQGKDVELGVPGHRVAVVGVVKLLDGRYLLKIAHDTKQGEPGGTKTEIISYDPRNKKFRGGKWISGKSLKNFVIEYPTPPSEPEDAARRLGKNTGTEHKTEHEEPLDIPRHQYVDFMRYDLGIYVSSTHPSVTQEMKRLARQLLEFLDSASEADKQRMAEVYVDAYWEGYEDP